MKAIVLFVVAAFSLMAAGGPALSEEESLFVVGYYTSWAYYDDVTPEIYANAGITHINYAFANIGPQGCILGDPEADEINFQLLAQAKAANPELKVLISIGGGSWSPAFAEFATTYEGRNRIVSTCISLFLEGENGLVPLGLVDGFDVDWETWDSSHKESITLLIQAFRDSLDQLPGEQLLTMAVPAVAYGYSEVFDLPVLAQSVNWFNVMAYDFVGPWTESKTIDYHSPFSVGGGRCDRSEAYQPSFCGAIHGYLAEGVPANKIVVGIPLYGWAFTGVEVGRGAGATWQGLLGGDGYLSINEIHETFGPSPRGVDEISGMSFWTQDQAWVAAESAQSIAAKYCMANNLQLLGVMFWEITQAPIDYIPTGGC